MADASDPSAAGPAVRASSDPADYRFGDEAESGGSFVVGLLAGTVLGAGLAMIFGPKASLSSGEAQAVSAPAPSTNCAVAPSSQTLSPHETLRGAGTLAGSPAAAEPPTAAD
jgi:hypothetical protein